MNTPPIRVKSAPGETQPQLRAQYGPCILRLLEYVPVTAISEDVWMTRTVRFLTLLGQYLSGPGYAAKSARSVSRKARHKAAKTVGENCHEI